MKREGVEIHPQMFKELLARKSMVLLFDGLDEVATLDERRRLVEEIEGFALRYPGNYVLVTSRPVGYELAPISSQWFAQAEVQEFDDTQIRQFLERWYTHVLRLSPLPSDDRQELEALYKTLQDNPRLHKLAVNPLLLTVITALHRYERLPDKRILVYDRCADLLLDTWARLKGTDTRWQNMKMSKDDQYACVAHLGYVLHTRSQEQANGDEESLSKDTDVPSRFLAREIEHFLNKNGLLKEVAEQRTEAKRFLELMRVEAGLIVERGTSENDKALYGFVHRTFQEYFAAADVYMRYLQEEEPEIINEFLVQYLHDPHWQEVILLLLGKLGRKPLTARLQQILDRKIVSRRSQYTDILQQDLFFVSSCLEEELVVELTLAEKVIALLIELVKTSPFSSQCEDALIHLGTLLHSRQYSVIAQKALLQLATKDTTIAIQTIINVLSILYVNSSMDIQQLVLQTVADISQWSDLLLEQSVQVAQSLYENSARDSEERRFASSLLMTLVQRSDLSLEQSVQVAQSLYENSARDSEECRFASSLLMSLVQRSDLSFEQSVQVAQSLYRYSAPDSEERRFAVSLLMSLVQRADLSFEQSMQAAQFLYHYSAPDSEERRFAASLLMSLVQRADLSSENALQIANTFNQNWSNIEEKRVAAQLYVSLIQQELLSVDDRNSVYKSLRDLVPQFDKLLLA